MAGPYELFRRRANRPSDIDKVGLVRLEEAKQSGKQFRLGGTPAQLFSPDSGHVDEPLRPTVVPERCGKRAKRESDGVIWVSLHRR